MLIFLKEFEERNFILNILEVLIYKFEGKYRRCIICARLLEVILEIFIYKVHTAFSNMHVGDN